jgi:UDP-N-acetyl-D-glucosamine dehydrogenase
VRYCDPHIPSLELDDEGHAAVPWSAEEVAAADCVVMLTAHREFLDEPHWDDARLVVDTRNVVPRGPHVFSI